MEETTKVKSNKIIYDSELSEIFIKFDVVVKKKKGFDLITIEIKEENSNEKNINDFLELLFKKIKEIGISITNFKTKFNETFQRTTPYTEVLTYYINFFPLYTDYFGKFRNYPFTIKVEIYDGLIEEKLEIKISDNYTFEMFFDEIEASRNSFSVFRSLSYDTVYNSSLENLDLKKIIFDSPYDNKRHDYNDGSNSINTKVAFLKKDFLCFYGIKENSTLSVIKKQKIIVSSKYDEKSEEHLKEYNTTIYLPVISKISLIEEELFKIFPELSDFRIVLYNSSENSTSLNAKNKIDTLIPKSGDSIQIYFQAIELHSASFIDPTSALIDGKIVVQKKKDENRNLIFKRGMNFIGICNNDNCLFHKKRVICNLKLDKFHFHLDKQKELIKCKECNNRLTPQTVGFHSYYFWYSWEYFENERSECFSLKSEYKQLFDDNSFKFFQNEKEKINNKDWKVLTIFVDIVEPSKTINYKEKLHYCSACNETQKNYPKNEVIFEREYKQYVNCPHYLCPVCYDIGIPICRFCENSR